MANLRVAVVNAAVEPGIESPDALLARYQLTQAWADAVARAGGEVVVVQRFRRDLVLRRGIVDYHFVAEAPLSRQLWGYRAARTLRALRPDVVHVDGLTFPMLVGYLRLALASSTTIVVQDHGGIHDDSPGFSRLRWRAFHRVGLAAADGFLFTAREQAAPWLRAGIVDGSQPVYEIVECSSDLGLASADSKGAIPGRPALLWVGRLNANKDPLTVLRGFEMALETVPDAHLTMVFSESPLLADVKATLSASALLAPRVHLRGFAERAELPALYASADLFVLGSHHEGSGIALMEAMSFGATPIVTDIPSFRVITDSGRLGALFPTGDAFALARAIVKLAGCDLSSRRAPVADFFEHDLSWPSIGRKALGIYRTAAAARGRTK
jgi:glycosyltransferase involved in cell wall biosynthesis